MSGMDKDLRAGYAACEGDVSCKVIGQDGRGSSEILGIDHVEMYVNNARESAMSLREKFGFRIWEDNARVDELKDASSYIAVSGCAKLRLTSALDAGAIAEYVQRHGESVRDVSMLVANVDAAYRRAIEGGATGVISPHCTSNGQRTATVGTPGDVVHSLVQVCAGMREEKVCAGAADGGCHHQGDADDFIKIDHVAMAVGAGELDRWVRYYEEAFGFKVTYSDMTETDLSAMRSKVVENPTGTLKLPIVEPATGRIVSQIEEFIRAHNGPGVQHIALLCRDICESVRKSRKCGTEFRRVPNTYYDSISARMPAASQVEKLMEGRILFDRDEWGELLQIFSGNISVSSCVFMELIQRNGARGFGAGNIRALFEALEHEQMVELRSGCA
jgi:4-hydroxyphenylpyruvate dioxygenase